MNQAVVKQYLRETYEFFMELVKSPIPSIQKRHNLNWIQIITYYVVIASAVSLVASVFKGFVLVLLLMPIQIALSTVIGYGVIFWIATLIMDMKNIAVDKLELAQAWLKGAIWGVLVGSLLGMLSYGLFGALYFLEAVAPVGFITGSIYLYYKNKENEDQAKVKKITQVVGGLLLALLILSYGGLMGVMSLAALSH